MNAGDLIRDVSLRLAERTDDDDLQGFASDLNQALDTLLNARVPLNIPLEGEAEDDEQSPTIAQTIALGRLMRDFECITARVDMRPFDLPDGYVIAFLRARSGSELHFGIAPNGDTSS